MNGIQTSRARLSERDMRVAPFLTCEFLTQTANQFSPFTSVAVASGTLAAPNVVTPDHPGVVRVRSSTNANSGYLLGANQGQIHLSGGERFNLIFYIDTLALSTFRVGLHDATTETDPVDGCYIEVASTGVATGKTSSNSSRSSTGTTYTLVTSTWYRLQVALNGDATRADFTVFSDAGEVLWTDSLTTNIPTGASRQSGASLVATNSGTSAIDLCHVDYMSVELPGLARG